MKYPTYKLGEIIDKVPIEFKVKQKEYLPKGKFPVVDQGQDLIGGFVDDESLLVKTELPVIVFGDHTKAKKFIDFPFVAGADGTKIIKPKKEIFIEPKLFYWFLHCVKFPDKGYARHFQYLLKSDIAVPPLATQRAIVTRIETLFAELDKGVEKLKTAQQQLKVYRQAVLNDCLTKGSEKWEIVKLGDIILNMRNGYGKKPTDNGKYRILRISSVRPMNIDFSDYRNNSTDFADNDKIKPNNLLFTRYNGSKEFVGVCASVPNIEEQYAYPDKIICCTLKCDNQYHSKYLQYYLNQGEALAFIRSKIKTTSGQNGIAGSDLKKVTIFLPPLSTQQRIVQEIETRLSACDEVEKQIAESLQQAEALRQSILKKAFSGELV